MAKNKPSESDILYIKQLAHYIKYINEKPGVEDWEIYNCVMEFEKLGKKMIENQWEEHSVDEYIDLNLMKEMTIKFLNILANHIKNDETQQQTPKEKL